MEQVTHADRHILNVCVCPCFICPLEGTVETQIPFFPSSERCPLQIYSAFDFGIAHYNSISNNWRYLYLSHMCVWLSMNDTGCCVARSWGCLCHLPLLSLQDRSSPGRWPVGHHFQGVWQVRQALFCVCVCTICKRLYVPRMDYKWNYNFLFKTTPGIWWSCASFRKPTEWSLLAARGSGGWTISNFYLSYGAAPSL